MTTTMTNLPEIKLVGITARTNNASEFNPTTAKIGATIQKYFAGQVPEKITNRIKPSMTYCVYTEYESDMTGDYTYFIGEEVSEFGNLPEGLATLVIPAQAYAKFTSEPAAMPAVCINLWQKIWQMTPADFGGQRTYIADFEIYDQRAMDPQNTILDIYIGIKK